MEGHRAVEGQVVFLLGPSGAGKTTLGNGLADNANLLHIQVDRFPEGDGIDLEGLRREWEKFLEGDAKPFVSVLRDRAATAGRRGAVLSFPGLVVFPPERIRAIARDGITTVVLYGPAAECRDAFLEHERQHPRVAGDREAHWEHNNRAIHTVLGDPAYDFVRVLTFVDGQRRSLGDLVASVMQLVAGGAH